MIIGQWMGVQKSQGALALQEIPQPDNRSGSSFDLRYVL